MTLRRLRSEIVTPAMRPVLLIPLFGVMLVIAIWAAVLTRLAFDYETLFGHAFQDVETFAAGFEEHSIRALRDVDRTALLVKSDFERDGNVNLADLVHKGLIPTDGFVQVSVTDSDGNVVATTEDVAGTINIGDREHFKIHRQVDTTTAYISAPILDRLTRRTAIAVSRRLNLGDRLFAGVVVVAVDPRYFTDFYQERYLGTDGLLAVIGLDGAFRARRVGDRLDNTGDASRGTVFQRAQVKSTGVFRTKSAIDGVDRLFAYRRMQEYPLILLAGRAEAEVLAEYRSRRLAYVLIASAATLAIAAFFSAGTLLFYRLRRSQQRAQQAEALFRAAAEASLDAFVLLRRLRDRRGRQADFTFAEANPRAMALLRFAGTGLRGRRLSAVLRRARKPEMLSKYLAVAATGEPLEEEIQVAPPGQPSVWVRQQVVRVPDGVAVMARDITEERRHEERLRQQTAFMETLVGHLPVGVLVRSARPASLGRIVLWNHACEYTYGISASEALGKTFREVLPAYADRVEQWDREMLASPMVQHFAKAPVDIPGRGCRYLDFVRAPIFDAHDQVEFIISIGTDVTQDKAHEEELRLASKVFETTADAVLVSDADDRVIMSNQAFTDMTGYSADEVRGRKVQDLPFAAGHRHSEQQFAERLKREGRISQELTQVRKDGRPLPCWTTASCVLDGRGGIVNFVRVFSDISALKASQHQLERLANYDTLTGLPNRRLFQDRLELALHRARRAERGAALLFIDLDGLKEVNDTIGHDLGDRLLREAASRLVDTVRVVDSVSRLGGDEFTIVVEEAALPEAAINVAQRVLQTMAEPFTVGGHRIVTSASVGIALFPQDGADATALLRCADTAMYKAKRAGRNRYMLCASDGNQELVSRITS